MAAPLDNSNAQVNGAAPAGTINHGEANFDPTSHAEKANREFMEQKDAEHAAEIRRIQEDSDARMSVMRDDMNQMKGRFEEISNRPPPEPEAPRVSLDDKYRLDKEEEETYGDMLGVVNKRAAYYAEKAHNAAFEAASTMFSTREAKLQQEIDGLKQQVQTANKGVVQNFEANARGRAANYGLDLDNLQQNPEWVQLMGQPVSAVSDTTFSELVTAAVQGQDMTTLERVFSHYANDFKRPSGNSLSGLPNTNRVDNSGTAPSPQGSEDIMAQLQSLENERESLRDDINRRRISTVEFSEKLQAIDKKVIDLRRQLT